MVRRAPINPALPVEHPVVIGQIVGVYGVKGWVKVRSFTDPAENVLSYQPWYVRHADRSMRCDVIDARVGDKVIVAQLSGFNVREEALEWVGAEIVVDRSMLPAPGPGEYYWADLIGLRVATADGVELGVIERMLETGANDVLVIRGDRERLVPFIYGQVVKDVDLAAGRMTVDWDPEF